MPNKVTKTTPKARRAATVKAATNALTESGWTLTEREFRGECRPVPSRAAIVILKELRDLAKVYPQIDIILDLFVDESHEEALDPLEGIFYTPTRVRGKGWFHPKGTSPKKREKKETKGREKGEFDLYHGPVCTESGKEVPMKAYRKDVKASEYLKKVHGFTPVAKQSTPLWVTVPNTANGFVIEGWRVTSTEVYFLDVFTAPGGRKALVISRKIVRLKKSTDAYK